MDRRIIRGIALALVVGVVALMAAALPRAGYAAPGEQAEADSFYLIIRALRYADDQRLFNDDSPLVSLTESLNDWLITELVNPNAPASQEQTRDRETLLGNLERYHLRTALEEVLAYLRKYDLLSVALAEALADSYIGRIAELTGDTPEAVRELLAGRTDLDMSDRAALVTLYNATDGDSWDDNTNWLSDLPLDRWRGVGMDEGRVSGLDLSDNGLIGEIPLEIGSLSKLAHLDLSDNGLTGEIPTEIGNLTELRYLELSRNRLIGEIPTEIGKLAELRHLDLSYNELTGKIPTEIGKLAELRHLKLNGNELTGEIPPEIGNLTELHTLDLLFNGLTGEIPIEIGKLAQLRDLNLSGNKLTGEIPTEITNLTELRSLSLDQIGLTGEIPAEIGSLSELRILSLDYNDLTGEIPAEIGKLAELYALSLSNNKLTGEIPKEIISLPKLRYLDLSYNELTGQIPMELVNLNDPGMLDIDGNRFTGCVPDGLYDIQFDNILTPHGTTTSFDNFNHFKLPRCSQMSALAALYEATDGDDWTDNTNWLSDKPVGEWHGVMVDKPYDYNVIRLELGNNGLSGRIPPELGKLTSLRRLSLFGNQLSGNIPAELGNLSNLESLSLGGNRISGCLPDGLRYVPRIDISALGVPFCGSGAAAPAPSLALAAFAVSPTEVNLFWLNSLEAESVVIYRNGVPVATPPLDLSHHTDSGLSPNARYQYRIGAIMADRSVEVSDESSAATLAHPPRMVEFMDVNESGFTLVIADESNPPGTEYRGAVSVSKFLPKTPEEAQTKVILSDWSASRCVTFEGLTSDASFSGAVARNLDGVETDPRQLDIR